MIWTIDRERILERRIDIAVVDRPTKPIDLLREAELETGTARVADVVEEADIRERSACRLKQNVVSVDRVERSDPPTKTVVDPTAETHFSGPCDDLIERRIRQECVRQVAG